MFSPLLYPAGGCLRDPIPFAVGRQKLIFILASDGRYEFYVYTLMYLQLVPALPFLLVHFVCVSVIHPTPRGGANRGTRYLASYLLNDRAHFPGKHEQGLNPHFRDNTMHRFRRARCASVGIAYKLFFTFVRRNIKDSPSCLSFAFAQIVGIFPTRQQNSPSLAITPAAEFLFQDYFSVFLCKT